tara:strand:+ start:480 stop:1199 length:720 start_codon:yes stop_codon:yes gene_type:complete
MVKFLINIVKKNFKPSYYLSLILNYIEHLRIGNSKFIFISNNCFGTELYFSTKRNYNTPIIGVYLWPDCYIKFLSEFEKNLDEELIFINKSRYLENENLEKGKVYPIAIINNNIEIHFYHYTSEEDAKNKWRRRIERMKKDLKNGCPLFIKICDRDKCTTNHLELFHKLPFKNKISISTNSFNHEQHIVVPKLRDMKGDYVIDGFALYKKRYKYLDFAYWIKYRKIKKSFISKFLGMIS